MQALPPQFKVGYLLQNGAPDLATVSGPQLHTTAVIQGLRKLGHAVRTVAIQRYEIGWSDDLSHWSAPSFKSSSAPWFRLPERAIRRVQSELRLPFCGIFDSLRYADACSQVLHGYDLLYERHGYMGYGGAITARRLGIPLILELNGNILREIDEMGVQMSKVQRQIGRWITIQTLRAAHHVIVVSEALKRILVSDLKIQAGKISVLLNGVDVETFARSYNPEIVRKEYDLQSSMTITFVGSFQPWHGVDLLIAAFKEVVVNFPDSQLVLVGAGSGRESAVKQIDQLDLRGKVRLLGHLEPAKVAAVLSVSDLAVAPYPFTRDDIVGSPLKMMEYMAAGKAIVASTAPIHEIVNDGVSGIRVPPADQKALAQGIMRLIRDRELRCRLASNAAEQGRKYSWARVINTLSEIFAYQLSQHSEHSFLTRKFASN